MPSPPWLLDYRAAAATDPAEIGDRAWSLAQLACLGFDVPAGLVLRADALPDPTPSVAATRAARTLAPAIETLPELADFPPTVHRAVHAFCQTQGLPLAALTAQWSLRRSDLASPDDAPLSRPVPTPGAPLSVSPEISPDNPMPPLASPAPAARAALVLTTGIPNVVAQGDFVTVELPSGRRDRIALTFRRLDGSVDARVLVASGTGPVEVVARDGRVTVDEALCTRVARLAARVEWALGEGQQPMTGRWVFDGATCWIVAAEPFENAPRPRIPIQGGQPTIWSNGNLGDAIAGVPTTATWSFIQPYLNWMLAMPFVQVGYPVPEGMQLVRRVDGRAYLDLSSFQAVSYDSLGAAPADANRGLGGPQVTLEFPKPTGRDERRRRRARVRLLGLVLRQFRTYPRAIEQLRAAARAALARDVRDVSTAELMRRAEELAWRQIAFGPAFQLGNLGASVFGSVLGDVLVRSLPDPTRAARLATALLSGGGDVVSAEQGYGVYELAAAAQRDPAARAWLRRTASSGQGTRGADDSARTGRGSAIPADSSDPTDPNGDSLPSDERLAWSRASAAGARQASDWIPCSPGTDRSPAVPTDAASGPADRSPTHNTPDQIGAQPTSEGHDGGPAPSLGALAGAARSTSRSAGEPTSERFDPGDVTASTAPPPSGPFRDALDAFLRDFGHRAVYEAELANPRWREDPTYLLEQVRALLGLDQPPADPPPAGASPPPLQPADPPRSAAPAAPTVAAPLAAPPVHREGRPLAQRSVLPALPDPTELRARALARRRAAEAELQRVPLPSRLLILWLADRARRAAALREAGKSALVALAEPVRVLLLEFGRRLAAADVLHAPEDVFHLARADLEASARGEWSGAGARALVALRRARRGERQLGPPPPDLVRDPDHTERHANRHVSTAQRHVSITNTSQSGETPGPDQAHGSSLTMEASPSVLVERRGEGPTRSAAPVGPSEFRGLAAAAGVARGRVRRIAHPAFGAQLQAGEILVAPSTDPGWTPLFLRAAAIVTEAGGLLSHGAIVAREFGLPAVVNVPQAMTLLHDGDDLTVDGNTGKLFRHARADHAGQVLESDPPARPNNNNNTG